MLSYIKFFLILNSFLYAVGEKDAVESGKSSSQPQTVVQNATRPALTPSVAHVVPPLFAPQVRRPGYINRPCSYPNCQNECNNNSNCCLEHKCSRLNCVSTKTYQCDLCFSCLNRKCVVQGCYEPKKKMFDEKLSSLCTLHAERKTVPMQEILFQKCPKRCFESKKMILPNGEVVGIKFCKNCAYIVQRFCDLKYGTIDETRPRISIIESNATNENYERYAINGNVFFINPNFFCSNCKHFNKIGEIINLDESVLRIDLCVNCVCHVKGCCNPVFLGQTTNRINLCENHKEEKLCHFCCQNNQIGETAVSDGNVVHVNFCKNCICCIKGCYEQIFNGQTTNIVRLCEDHKNLCYRCGDNNQIGEKVLENGKKIVVKFCEQCVCSVNGCYKRIFSGQKDDVVHLCEDHRKVCSHCGVYYQIGKIKNLNGEKVDVTCCEKCVCSFKGCYNVKSLCGEHKDKKACSNCKVNNQIGEKVLADGKVVVVKFCEQCVCCVQGCFEKKNNAMICEGHKATFCLSCGNFEKIGNMAMPNGFLVHVNFCLNCVSYMKQCGESKAETSAVNCELI